MPRFNYVALDARGQESTGLLEANSSNEVIGQLRQAGFFPTSVFKEGKAGSRDGKGSRSAAKALRAATKPRARREIVLFQRRKVKPKILMIFTRQLATLIDSGLPLLRGLTVLGKQERDKTLKRTIDKLADGVQGGSAFSDTLALHPAIFNNLFVNMVKAGEAGGVTRKSAISRFSRTLGTLVTSGVPILQALNITRETAGNMVIAKAISRVHESVKEGESIVQPLEASRVFPPMVISMVDVGEETGQLPEMLLKIADVYDDEVDSAVAGMTAALEPLMIVFLAVIVGTIVIALFMPLVSIIQGLQQQG